MKDREFEEQLSLLRQGKLTLYGAGQDGLTEYAGGTINEMRRYVAALEQGYRAKTEEAGRLRKLMKKPHPEDGKKLRLLVIREKDGSVRKRIATNYAVEDTEEAFRILVIRDGLVVDTLPMELVSEVRWEERGEKDGT